MSKKLLGVIPVGLDLASGFVIQFTAVDSTTGADVPSVIVSEVSLLVDNISGGDLESGFGDTEPLFTPIPATEA